jgi:hypothetical protein
MSRVILLHGHTESARRNLDRGCTRPTPVAYRGLPQGAVSKGALFDLCMAGGSAGRARTMPAALHACVARLLALVAWVASSAWAQTCSFSVPSIQLTSNYINPATANHSVLTGGAFPCDDCTLTVALPFPVVINCLSSKVSANDFGKIIIASNGWISFSSVSQPTGAASYTPSLPVPDGLIAPFWTDWWGPGTGTGAQAPGVIYMGTSGTAPNRILVVSWVNMVHYFNRNSKVISTSNATSK